MLSTLGNAIAHAAWAMQTTSEPAAGICMQYILLTTTGCSLQLPVSQFYQQQTMYPGHMVRHQHSPMAQANTKCRRQPRKQHATSQLSLLSHYLGQQQPSLVTSSTETPQNPAHVLAVADRTIVHGWMRWLSAGVNSRNRWSDCWTYRLRTPVITMTHS